MILIIKEKHTKEYRLNSYEDYYNQLPHFCQCQYYGLDSVSYDPNKTIDDIISDMAVKPDIIFVMAPLFKFSNWDNIKAKKYLLVTDSFDSNEKMQKAKHYPRMDEIKWDGVFHHYLYALDFMKSKIKSNWVYWPNWASELYNAQDEKWNMRIKKNLDFFLSGKYSSEYAMRKIFHKAFHKSGLDCLDNFSEKRVNNIRDNSNFWIHLIRSKYSPHDGGINGRVVPRYTESSYAKSVIISPDLGREMKLLGFIPGINYIKVKRTSNIKSVRNQMKEIAKYSDWERLSTNAYNLVKENHTTECRIKQFLEEVAK